MTAAGHWRAWHEEYDKEDSPLRLRLGLVRRRLGEALDQAPAGPVRLISLCAGQGRDVIGVLPAHRRRGDVSARLVELDPVLAAEGREAAEVAGLGEVEVVHGDASLTDAYRGAVPADVVLACGVFGNISNEHIRTTVDELPHLCAPGATVIWTRHHKDPDLTPSIRGWLGECGFEEVCFDTREGYFFSVGTHRFAGPPRPLRPGRRMFWFFGDGADAHG
ncbi:MAG: SAM-dependent methyltransferase [Acidimicrobiales bacterium]